MKRTRSASSDRPGMAAKRRRANPTPPRPRTAPIELFYWPTPNGWKISIMLEECGLPYVVRPVDISKGEQFAPAFLAISPNNRIPALSIRRAQAGGRSRFSNPAPSCNISAARPESSIRATNALALRSMNGCSGKWAD
jgi:hypothetical protein